MTPESNTYSEKSFPATTEGLVDAAAYLESFSSNPKAAIVLDEIVSNIVRCSGATTFTLRVDNPPDAFSLVFLDDGTPFDPTTEVAEPDITLPAAERNVGGLGFFMVKRLVTSISYARRDGKNVLTVVF